MADRTHYSKPFLGLLETGKRAVKPEHVASYARALDVAPEELSDHVAPGDLGALGAGSAQRTSALLESITPSLDGGLGYRPPTEAVNDVREFVDSTARVYLLAGPAGVGKTRLAYHLAGSFTSETDVQLHAASSWVLPEVDLATEILRYGSLSGDEEVLLRLEVQADRLLRPCMIVIDAIASQHQFDQIARQIDVILRQVRSPALRFVLVIRTPPRVRTASYPVLDASLFRPSNVSTATSGYPLARWAFSEARSVWEATKPSGAVRFEALPNGLQHLARLPLYMKLLLAAGSGVSTTAADPYALLDYCVRSVLRVDIDEIDGVLHQLGELAEQQLPAAIPTSLLGGAPTRDRSLRIASDESVAAIVHTRADGHEFVHDILGEYALATCIARLLADSGRSVMTVRALNELAEQAMRSASARTVFALVCYAMDRDARPVVTAAAAAPTASTTTTLPLLLGLAAIDSDDLTTTIPGFVTADLLRTCAQRCGHNSSQALVRALLAVPALAAALGPNLNSWLLDILRRFGTAIWDSAAQFVEQCLDAPSAQALWQDADLDQGEETPFFARHWFLFIGDNPAQIEQLAPLLGHPNWRVRAALVQGLGQLFTPGTDAEMLVLDAAATDTDYKVRAAVALALPQVAPSLARLHLAALLRDENWHVREQVLHGVLEQHRGTVDSFIENALDLIASDQSWSSCPTHVRAVLDRLHILHGRSIDNLSNTTEQALFAVLRELRTGWLTLPQPARTNLIDTAQRSAQWLVIREADALSTNPQPYLTNVHEEFRRLRNRRCIQAALDMHNLDEAASIAQAIADTGVDFLEVGDPLIKQAGLHAIARIKHQVPDITVVAEMMSADWGRDQVVLAAGAGADVVLLIGPATTASVFAATQAGRRLGVPILLDAPLPLLSQTWVHDMEQAGVDGFTITTNIDIGIGSRHALTNARTIRSWTQLPVAVSGGFSPTDHDIITAADWDILIVGRSIADATNPHQVAQHLVSLIQDTTQESRP